MKPPSDKGALLHLGVERSLLVRWPFALWLVEGSKTVEVRRSRHRFYGERVGIIATSVPWQKGATAYMGSVMLGHCRSFSIEHVEDFAEAGRVASIAAEARASIERLRAYQGDRPTLWAWETLDPLPTWPRPVIVPSGAQTWVRQVYVPPLLRRELTDEYVRRYVPGTSPPVRLGQAVRLGQELWEETYRKVATD